MKELIPKIALIAVLLATLGCEDEKKNNTQPKDNTPPKIEGVKENYIVVSGGELELKANVSDADGDPVTISWKQTLGEPLWKEQPTGPEVTLKIPPRDVGSGKVPFVIDILASDGKEETLQKIVITSPFMETEKLMEWDCPDDDACTDIVFHLDDINSYRIYEGTTDKFEIKMSSESGAVFNFDDDTDIALFYIDNPTSVKDMFSFDEVTNTLYVKKERISDFNSLLNTNDRINMLHIGSDDTSGNDVTKEVLFYYGYGSVKGTLVDQEGNAYSGLEGEIIELKGGKNSYYSTYLTAVKPDGTFEFKNLRTDNYLITMQGENDISILESADINPKSKNIKIEAVVNKIWDNSNKGNSKNLTLTDSYQESFASKVDMDFSDNWRKYSIGHFLIENYDEDKETIPDISKKGTIEIPGDTWRYLEIPGDINKVMLIYHFHAEESVNGHNVSHLYDFSWLIHTDGGGDKNKHETNSRRDNTSDKNIALM